MKLNVIVYSSSLHDESHVSEAHAELLSKLGEKFEVTVYPRSKLLEIDRNVYTTLLIATGGVENLIVEDYHRLPAITTLLADGRHNSLAASLEISAWLRSRNRNVEVVHGTLDYMADRLYDVASLTERSAALRGSRIGVIGKPSAWLIASGINYADVAHKWGVEVLDIPINEVVEEFGKVTPEEVKEFADEFIKNAKGMKEATAEDVVEATRLYKAIRTVVERYDLSAFTISCFHLLDITHTTGCLALAFLNDAGIPAGCEGDIPTLFTMVVAKVMTGKPGFMANPSRVNPVTGEIVFAHCTVGLTQTEGYTIRSHFESSSGVAVQGMIKEGPATVFKIGGEKLDQFFITSAQLEENLDEPFLCRTQIRMHIDKDPGYFLKNPLGNHHVILSGGYTEVIKRFLIDARCHEVK